MRSRSFALGLVVVACGTGLAAEAQTRSLDFNDRGFAEAAGGLMVVDYLRERCATAGQAPLADRLRRWEADNRTSRLRQAMATARNLPDGARRHDRLRDGVAQRLAPKSGQACSLLEAWLASPNSRMAQATPDVFAALGEARSSPNGPPTSAVRATAPVQGSPKAPAPGAAKAAIQGYGLIQSYGMGYGGMMIVKYEPAILFKSGEILTDIKAMAGPAGLEADRRAHPTHWSRWRLADGVYQYATRSGKWQKISGNKVWTTPPSVAGLSGTFVHVGGGGDLAFGGSSAVFTQSTYTFLPGGRLVRRGLASGSAEVEGGGSTTRTVTTSRSGGRPGRYTVDGLFMTVAYDDGQRETLAFMTHPSDTKIVWLNGLSFVRE